MLKADKAVLVVVDIQGKLATLMHNREVFYQNVIRMINGARALEIPILWNEQLPDKLGETIPEIKEVLRDKKPLIKKSFSCCGNPDFVDQLKQLKCKQVLLVGMETHICIYRTALDLLHDGYKVYLVTDAVASRVPENKQLGIEVIKERGGLMTSVEMALFEIFDTAEGDKFKQMVQIVK
nr:hydrolase [candidate division Zixibacteria bacterium]